MEDKVKDEIRLIIAKLRSVKRWDCFASNQRNFDGYGYEYTPYVYHKFSVNGWNCDAKYVISLSDELEEIINGR